MGLDNPIHIAFLLILLLLVFGAKRLPEMGRSLGHGLRGFKESLSPDTPQQHAAIAPAPATVAPVIAPAANTPTPAIVPVALAADDHAPSAA